MVLFESFISSSFFQNIVAAYGIELFGNSIDRMINAEINHLMLEQPLPETAFILSLNLLPDVIECVAYDPSFKEIRKCVNADLQRFLSQCGGRPLLDDDIFTTGDYVIGAKAYLNPSTGIFRAWLHRTEADSDFSPQHFYIQEILFGAETPLEIIEVLEDLHHFEFRTHLQTIGYGMVPRRRIKDMSESNTTLLDYFSHFSPQLIFPPSSVVSPYQYDWD